MTARPLALFLREFAPEPAVAALVLAPKSERPEQRPQALLPPPLPDTDRLDLAREEGRQEGVRAERVRAERELAELRSEHEAALSEARARWCRDEAEGLVSRFEGQIGAFEHRMAEQVAGILGEVLLKDASRRMVAELAELVRGQLASSEVPIRVSGPDDLLEALRGHIAEVGGAIAVEATRDADLRVEIGDAQLETRLAAWRDLLRAELN